MEDQQNKKSGDKAGLKKLMIMGDTYLTRYTRKYENRKHWVQPDKRQLISFIPGTVRKILVKEGDSVQFNQVLLVLEAMKMMNSITAPEAGKIKSIKVGVGDCIPKGTLMIEFE